MCSTRMGKIKEIARKRMQTKEIILIQSVNLKLRE